LLYFDILHTYKTGYKDDFGVLFREFGFKALKPYVNMIELIHRQYWIWSALTFKMSISHKRIFGKKSDKFLVRIQSALSSAIFNNQHQELSVYPLFADYLKYAPSSVTSSNVIDVCFFEPLKSYLIAHIKLSVSTIDYIPIMYHFIRIMEYVTLQNHHGLSIELFISLYMEHSTLAYFKQITKKILFSKSLYKLSSPFTENPKRFEALEPKLLNIGSRVFRWLFAKWKSIKKLLKKKCAIKSKNRKCLYEIKNPQRSFSNGIPNIFGSCRPKTGYIPRIKTGNVDKGNPFVRSKIYIETFVSEHYLMYLKQYNAPLMHSDILTLCDLHPQILFAFSQKKKEWSENFIN